MNLRDFSGVRDAFRVTGKFLEIQEWVQVSPEDPHQPKKTFDKPQKTLYMNLLYINGSVKSKM